MPGVGYAMAGDLHAIAIGPWRSTCLRYLETADRFLVWGTGSGSPHDPDWFRNLRKAEVTDVQGTRLD